MRKRKPAKKKRVEYRFASGWVLALEYPGDQPAPDLAAPFRHPEDLFRLTALDFDVDVAVFLPRERLLTWDVREVPS